LPFKATVGDIRAFLGDFAAELDGEDAGVWSGCKRVHISFSSSAPIRYLVKYFCFI
ncbi:unnamed protein product, partial [Prorocentrum cordatum]